MKKLISAILACAFVFTVAFTTFAAVSPSAPVIEETTTDKPTDIDPTIDQTTTAVTTEKTTVEGEDKTTDVGDVDETTTVKGDKETTTKSDVTSDKRPVSPDTGAHVGKTVSAAAIVAVALAGAVVYTTKKKAE